MAFGGSNKGNNYSDNTNTNGIKLYNQKGFDPSMIGLNYWNQYFSIMIAPALPENKRSSSSVYDYDKKMQVSINVGDAILLLDKIENKLLPEFGKDKDDIETFSVSVKTRNGLLKVGLGLDVIDEFKPYISIVEINKEDKKPKSEVAYEFKTDFALVNYADGEYQKSKEKHLDLYVFMQYLNSGIEALVGAHAHGERYYDRFSKRAQGGRLKKISKHLGLEKSKNNYNNNNDSAWGGDDADEKEVEKDDDIPF